MAAATALRDDRNVSRANTRVKQIVSQAYREVAANPNSADAPNYLRQVAKSLRKLSTQIELTKAAVKSPDWLERAMRNIERIGAVAEEGFDNTPVPQKGDDTLIRLASCQTRNTIRPVAFLKGIKTSLNNLQYADAAATMEAMADSLELGHKLAQGDLKAAKRKASVLANEGYVPASVVRHVLH